MAERAQAGGHLAEPQTADVCKQLNDHGKEVLNSHPYWIGLDSQERDPGDFRYSSTGIHLSIEGFWPTAHLDSANSENCMAFDLATGGRADDKKCNQSYSSICEMECFNLTI